jgi:hypothetical protein
MLPTYELKVDSFLGEGIIFIQNKCKFPIALHTFIYNVYEVWFKYYIHIICQSYEAMFNRILFCCNGHQGTVLRFVEIVITSSTIKIKMLHSFS